MSPNWLLEALLGRSGCHIALAGKFAETAKTLTRQCAFHYFFCVLGLPASKPDRPKIDPKPIQNRPTNRSTSWLPFWGPNDANLAQLDPPLGPEMGHLGPKMGACSVYFEQKGFSESRILSYPSDIKND
eukprot:12403420-Karenia_brevis.AAC.1